MFLALCVAPTVVVAAWIGLRLQPGWRRGVLDRIGHELALEVDCQRLTTPRPGHWRLEGCAFRDLETGADVLRVDRVDAWPDSPGSPDSTGLYVELGEAQAAPDALPALARRAQQRLETNWPRSLLATAKRLTLGENGTGASCWDGLRLRLRSLGKGDETIGRELLIDRPGSPEALTLHAQRNRMIEPATTRIQLDTHEDRVAVRHIAALLPGTPELGDRATFAGQLTIESIATGDGSLAGSIDALDANQISAGRLQAEGAASLQVEELSWREGRIVLLAAELQTGPGQIDRNVIYAANTSLGCVPSQELVDEWNTLQDQTLGFDALRVEVRIDSTGVAIRGGEAGLLTRGAAPLLFPPSAPSLSMAALVQTLAPGAPAVLPASPEAEALARRLPWPSVVR